MATAKAPITEIITADAAFKRCKPILDSLQDDIKKARRVVGREYNDLPDDQKKSFRLKISKEYGWTDRRIIEFARIERHISKKKEAINRGVGADTPIDQLDTELLSEISRTDNDLLEKAAREGMFSQHVSSRAVRTLRKTGQIPRPTEKSKTKTDLQKIRALMTDAQSHMEKASLRIAEITSIMENKGIADAKGKEATALIQAFERLCTKMATANPATSKRAFAILRGEA